MIVKIIGFKELKKWVKLCSFNGNNADIKNFFWWNQNGLKILCPSMQTNFLSIDGEDQIYVTLEAQLGSFLTSLVLI